MKRNLHLLVLAPCSFTLLALLLFEAQYRVLSPNEWLAYWFSHPLPLFWLPRVPLGVRGPAIVFSLVGFLFFWLALRLRFSITASLAALASLCLIAGIAPFASASGTAVAFGFAMISLLGFSLYSANRRIAFACAAAASLLVPCLLCRTPIDSALRLALGLIGSLICALLVHRLRPKAATAFLSALLLAVLCREAFAVREIRSERYSFSHLLGTLERTEAPGEPVIVSDPRLALALYSYASPSLAENVLTPNPTPHTPVPAVSSLPDYEGEFLLLASPQNTPPHALSVPFTFDLHPLLRGPAPMLGSPVQLSLALREPQVK